MNGRTSRLALALPPLAASALLLALAVRPAQTRALELSQPPLVCTQPPTYRVGYQREENGLQLRGEGFSFQGLSWLEADICAPGTLVLSAEGEVAGGAAPVLDIALNSRPLAREAFDPPRRVELRVPQAGRLTLSYFNDYYRADVRVAEVQHIDLKNTDCGGISRVDVPKATGGIWVPERRYAYLVFDVPMTVTPCAPGTLRMKVSGRPGGGVFPLLEFRQQGHVLLKVRTGETPRWVRLEVGAAPVSITLPNPYGRLVGDRNLNVRQLQFIPDQPSSP